MLAHGRLTGMVSGDVSDDSEARIRAVLLAEAQEQVRPLRLAARSADDAFVCDLLAIDGSVAVAEYGAGLDELLAVLVAEQRYLVEQKGRDSVRGATYLDKARQRVRRALDS